MSKVRSLQNNNEFPKIKIFWALLLFLASMNFMAKYFYFILVAFVVAIFVNKLKCVTNTPVILLFGIAGTYICYEFINGGSINAILKYLAFPISYIIGFYFVNSRSNNSLEMKERFFRFMLYSMVFGNFVHVLLNYIINFGSITRYTVDVWSGSVLNATGQASLFCLTIGVAVAILFSAHSNLQKIIVCSGLVVIMLYNFVLSCRSTFIMLFLTLLVALIHLFKQKNAKKSNHIIFFLAIVLAFLLAFSFNLFDLQTTILDSAFYERVFGEGGMGLSDTRGSSKISYLQNFWRYPFGGGYLKESFGYAHDIFLDTWDMVGVFGFAFVVFFIMYAVWSLIKVLKKKTISLKTRQIILCVYVVLFMEFCIEPVFVGTQWLFSSFCIICGGVDSLLLHQDSTKIET